MSQYQGDYISQSSSIWTSIYRIKHSYLHTCTFSLLKVLQHFQSISYSYKQLYPIENQVFCKTSPPIGGGQTSLKLSLSRHSSISGGDTLFIIILEDSFISIMLQLSKLPLHMLISRSFVALSVGFRKQCALHIKLKNFDISSSISLFLTINLSPEARICGGGGRGGVGGRVRRCGY